VTESAATRGESNERLRLWLQAQLVQGHDVRLIGLEKLDLGHSAEMLAFTLAWRENNAEQQQELVLRLRPPEPGLLEPYDLPRQYAILRALEQTDVRAPKVLWLEPSGEVLGRPFFVMEKIDGTAYEMRVPREIRADAELVRRMSQSLVEQLAAIHLVKLDAAEWGLLGDGKTYVTDELDHWAAEMQRVQRGPLPALERLLAELRAQLPETNPAVTLVHGDAKPGNYGYVGSEVTAVFDWEMAAVGDPRADIGYLEVLWNMSGVTRQPGALSTDDFVTYYESLTGSQTHSRAWYRAMQTFKLGVISLIGVMLFDAGHSDDLRLSDMGIGIPWFTQMGLRDLGIDEEVEAGPVTAREERVAEVRQRLESSV
jgi:aminoglycoside phosphotransferase (APT) family kinase protein